MLQASSSQSNFPLPVESTTMWDKDTAKKMAYVGMDHSSCDRSLEGNNENTANNDPKNCAKLNPAPARFDGGLHKFKKGVYHYLSTRNNNFSNRSQKGTLRVEHSFSRGEVAGMVIGGLVTLCFLAGFGLFIKSRKSPGGFPSRLFPNAYTSANTSSV